MAAAKGKTMTENDDRISIQIKAVPGSSRTELVGMKDGCLRVKIAAAPEDGKANAELIAFLSKTLHCAKRDIVVESGEKARIKRISFPGELAQALKIVLDK